MKLSDITCRLGVSSINGIGVFALRDIKKGEKMYCGELFSDWFTAEDLKKEPQYIQDYITERWPSVIDKSDFVYPFDILVCYMNYSDYPNYDSKTDTATRDIYKGAEVTEDYGKYKKSILWTPKDSIV